MKKTKKTTIPKPNTKIRRDAYGLYVRNDGLTFRPELTKYSYPAMQPAYEKAWRAILVGGDLSSATLDTTYAYAPDPTLFRDGEAVTARHVSQTPYARVTSADGTRAAKWWASDVPGGAVLSAADRRAEAWLRKTPLAAGRNETGTPLLRAVRRVLGSCSDPAPVLVQLMTYVSAPEWTE